MQDQQFRILLDSLGLSWKGYRKVRRGVKRRLDRYMQETRIGSVEALRSALEKNAERQSEVEQLLTVPISRFFRDRGVWETLEEHIVEGRNLVPPLAGWDQSFFSSWIPAFAGMTAFVGLRHSFYNGEELGVSVLSG